MSPRVTKSTTKSTSTKKSESSAPKRRISIPRVSFSRNREDSIKKDTTLSSSKPRQSRTKKLVRLILVWLGIFIVTLALVDYAVQYLNYKASVAIVNGERIYRKDFYTKLEQSYGSTIVKQMIDETLVYQEAADKNIEISSKDIDTEVDTLSEQYGGLEELQQELELRSMSMETLRHQIETTLIIEKILSNDITVSEDEIKEYYDQYKDVLFADTEVPSYEDAKETVKEQLRQQKIGNEVSSWLLELEGKATIKNNIESPKDYAPLLITRTFIADLFEKDTNTSDEDASDEDTSNDGTSEEE